jgi:hypothetical protein
VSVYGAVRANRDIPRGLKREANHLKSGQPAFRRKGDIMVQVWKEKRRVRMIGTMHDATILRTGWKDRKTNLQIKKSYAFAEQSKFTKGVNRADQYLSYY